MGGNVVITEEKKDGIFNRISSNYGTYDRANDVVTATQKVTGYSLTEKTRSKSNYAYWDRKNGYGYLLENPELWSEGQDTLYVRSEKMEFFDADRKVIATFDVRANSKDYTATSDFLLYFLKEDKAVFLGKPRFISDFSDAVAEEFYLFFNDKKLVRAELKDSCKVYFAEERDRLKTNWVKAKYISMNIKDDNLKDFTAEDDVTYFYLQEQQEKKDFFSNDASGSHLTAEFNEDGKLESMKMKSRVIGIYRFINNP